MTYGVGPRPVGTSVGLHVRLCALPTLDVTLAAPELFSGATCGLSLRGVRRPDPAGGSSARGGAVLRIRA